MGIQLPLKGAQHPHFSAHVYCGQMAEWIKMPLGTEVELDPGHIVLDGDAAPVTPKGAQQPPLFSADVYCGKWSPISTTAEYLFQFLVPSS